MNSPRINIYEDPTEYIPNYRTMDKLRNERLYMLNIDTPDPTFLNGLSDKSIDNLLLILKAEQTIRRIKWQKNIRMEYVHIK